MSLQTMKTSNPSLSSWEIRSNLEVHSSPDGSSPNFSWHQVLAQFKWEWMHSQGGVRSTNSIKIIVIHSILINRLSRNPICMKSIRKYPQFNSELPGTVNGDGAFVCLKVKAKSSFHWILLAPITQIVIFERENIESCGQWFGKIRNSICATS